MTEVEVNQETASEQRADAIGNALSWALMGLLAVMFAYAYLSHLVLR